MKKSTKAALYSGLLFPGTGLFFLKHYIRGSIFFIPALIAIVYILNGIGTVTNELSEKTKINPELILNTTALSNDIMANVNKHIPLYHQAISLFMIAWIISIISSYFAGRKQEVDVNPISTTE